MINFTWRFHKIIPVIFCAIYKKRNLFWYCWNFLQVNSWPFHCLYPSIIFDHGSYQFMRDIYTCCKKCNFPTYTSCIYAHGTPDWRCPSDGVHCIFECVKKYGPGVTDVIKKPDFTGIKSQITSAKIKITEVPKKLKCQKVEKLPNGKTCIRRLCVPLNLHWTCNPN